MANEIIVNAHSFEKRVAVLEENRLVELLVEKKKYKNVVGNIYKGVIQDILPGMGAAFINVGLQRTGFLHYSDIVTDFLDTVETEKHNLKHLDKDSSNIGKYLRAGEEIIVQVQKGPIGKKGARLTGQISIPGKSLVLFPNKNRIAISRKLNNPKERDRLRSILKIIKDENMGLIVRTAAEGLSEDELKSQYKSLKNTWRLIEKQISYAKPPICIYDENDIINTVVRDLFSEDTDRLVVDNKKLAAKLRSELKDINPELASRVEFYDQDSPIFDAYGIEKEIERIFKSRINLPSGGNIVIEQTEALVSVDINTGSFTGNKNYEETVRINNVEAASEIGRQMRLRDLSGIVVIDFIDMKNEKHKQQVLDALKKTLKSDRAKTKIYPFGPLGLVQVTRKRTRTSLLLTYSEPCPHCKGSGRILSQESVALKLYRWLQRAEFFIKDAPLEIFVHPKIIDYMERQKNILNIIPGSFEIKENPDISQGEFKVFNAQTHKELTYKYNS